MVLRARRLRAEFLLRARRDAEALRDLKDLRSLQAMGQSTPVEIGLTLDLVGEAERRAGHLDESRAAHEAARTSFASQLGEQHPFLVRNAALRSGASH